MGRPKNRKIHTGTQTLETYEADDCVISTLLHCSFIQANLSDQSLKISLKVDPEKCGSHQQVFKAFVRGDVICKSISAKVFPVEMCKSCDECGGMSPKQETVLSFTVVATDINSDCNICHDHGSLSKYRKCNESSFENSCIVTRAGKRKSKIKGKGKAPTFDKKENETVALTEKLEGKGAKGEVNNQYADPESRNEDSEGRVGNEDIARNEEKFERLPEPEHVSKNDSDDFGHFSENEHDDDDTDDKDFQLEDEEDILGEDDGVNAPWSKKKRKHRQMNMMKAKKRDQVDESEFTFKKKIFTCSGCGMQKNYGSEKCGNCPNETKPNESKYCEEMFKSKALLLERQTRYGPDPRFLCTECGATCT